MRCEALVLLPAQPERTITAFINIPSDKGTGMELHLQQAEAAGILGKTSWSS